MTAPAANATIRPFRKEDAPHVQRIVRTVFEEYGCTFDLDGFDKDLKTIDTRYRAERDAFWVLEEAGEVVGSIGATDEGGQGIEVHRLYLDPKVRGKRYGKLLLDHLLAWVRTRGKKRVFLWSDVRFKHAHQLYEKAGFEQSMGERVCNDIDESHEYGFELLLES